MITAFGLEAQDNCPNARIVYDLFHVVAKFDRKVMDRVRLDQADRLKQDKMQDNGSSVRAGYY